MQHEVLKRYTSNRGLDLKSSDLNRQIDFASFMKNAQYRKSGAPEKRKGFQVHSGEILSFGLYNYKRVDEDNLLEEIILSIGRNVDRLYFTTVSVDYSGSENAAYLSLYYDTTDEEYKCTIIEGTTQVLDMSLGVGIDESTPVTMSDLKNAIDALTGFTATISGTTTVPAAFCKIVRDFDVKADTWSGVAGYWQQVDQITSNVFDGTYSRRNSQDLENVSAVVINNVLYLSNGYDYLQKFDGQNVYRAGLPSPGAVTHALVGSGSISGANYVHRVQYVQYDAAGNIIEGNTSQTVATSASSEDFDVTVPNIVAGTGFNTNAAIVAGAQSGVSTINVDDGSGGDHTLQVGDTAYFYDGVTGDYVTRKVTARTASTITIAGAAVNVADNAVISNNLRISIQRNIASATTPTIFYLIEEIPNDPFNATQVYRDSTIDANIGALINPIETDRSAPPKGKYICSFQNLLFVCGNPEDPLRLYWSDIDSPEYFPAGFNQERIQNVRGDELTGCAPCGPVLGIFTETSTHVGSGTFADGNYRLEEKASYVGCSSHHSLTFVEGYLCWWSSRGPYRMAGGELPVPLGQTPEGESRISPVMDQAGYESNPALEPLLFRSKRCLGFNWSGENKLLFYLPAETTQFSTLIPNANSRVYAYDYSRDAWLEWDNLNMAGGACVYQDEVFFLNRRIDASSNPVSDLHRFHNINDAWAYQDNTDPIEWFYGPQWEHLGQPGVLKKFLELQVYTLEDVPNNEFSLTVRQDINFQADGVVAEFTLALTGSGYGQSAYGSDPYGDPSNPKFKHELYRGRVYSTRIGFYNNEPQQNAIVSGWEVLYTTPYRTEFKR